MLVVVARPLRRFPILPLLLPLLLALLPRSAPAQTVFTPLLVDRPYSGPSAPHLELEKYNLFIPHVAPPTASGYPVLIHLIFANFTATARASQITSEDGLLYRALSDGIAVVSASCTVSRGAGTGNPLDGGTMANGMALGPAYPGNGVFLPPSRSAPLLPRGYTGGTLHPYFDPARPMPEKDVVMLIQHVRANAFDFKGVLNPPLLDVGHIAVTGSSAAAITLMWCCFGQDHRDLWSDPQGQERVSTRPDAAILRIGVTWFPVLKQHGGPNGFHFPAVGPLTLDHGLYDLPAEFLADTSDAIQRGASALEYGTEDPAIAAQNMLFPTYLTYADAPQEKFDFTENATDVEDNPHSAWSGLAWKSVICSSRLVFTTLNTGHGVPDLEDATILGAGAQVDDQAQWLEAVFAGTRPWNDVGSALAGSNGPASLNGCGSVASGAGASLEIHNAPPGARALLYYGTAAGFTPWNGGTLVPAPQAAAFLTIGSDGAWRQSFTWPTLPPAFVTWSQAWFPDSGTPFGVAATNGLESIAP